MEPDVQASKLSRAKLILSHEGWRSLIRKGLSYAFNSWLSCGTYLIYEFDLNGQQVMSDSKPRINCSYRQIASLAEYDQLVAQGYGFGTRAFRPRLKKGAVAFCLFVDKVLASEIWLAASASAKKTVDPVPFKVDFEDGEACTGVRFTNPKYRRNGLSEYLYVAKLPYLKQHHLTKIKASVNVRNKVPQRTNEKLSGEIVAKGRYLRLFAWHYWKETSAKKTT